MIITWLLVGGLIGSALVYFWDEIQAWAENLWEKIKPYAQKAWVFLKKVGDKIKTFFIDDRGNQHQGPQELTQEELWELVPDVLTREQVINILNNRKEKVMEIHK